MKINLLFFLFSLSFFSILFYYYIDENEKTKYKVNIYSPIYDCPVYKYSETNYTSQFNEDKYVIDYFIKNNKSPFNRVYLEVGAFNGYDMSNTYALEHGYGWRGLLIEASPDIYSLLVKTNRPRSIKLNNVVCDEEGIIEYIDNKWGLGGIKNFRNNNWNIKKKIKVKCSPINKLIKENGIKYLDVFSLDVEGAEENILKTFDWNIPVRIWIIEVNALVLGGSESEKQKCRNVQNVIKSHGYKYLGVSSNKSVNEFYYDPNFDDKIKIYIFENNKILKYKKCTNSFRF